ncbi:MAG TPA: restriction system-associated AAA family ATPase [Nannocystaceae bacterium]|nr:restriction system-associated AAA family ATPase [Nannocystaceae bacterium]
MKIKHVRIVRAETCGNLLDEMSVHLRGVLEDTAVFDPLCLIGPNGAGKSQFLQVLAEIFQSVFHACLPAEERVEANGSLEFEIEYYIRPKSGSGREHVKISRLAGDKRRPVLRIRRKAGFDWLDCDLRSPATHALLPERVIGYTSGDNETLSLPFLVSRGGYAREVGGGAFHDPDKRIPDTRLMLIDYQTHLEVLVANLLLGRPDERRALLESAGLHELHSFRCIVQLAHQAVPRLPRRAGGQARKGVQLTAELERYIDQLRRCATCHSFDEKTETYIFDFWVNEETRRAFRSFWPTTMDLFDAFHKLSMLNDLAISRSTRERFRRDVKTRRFASRLPEPQDDDKVFRFEQVRFRADSGPVDYVSLSDGEHQRAQILGMLCMVSSPNVLFLLDEPESHFNPQWRVAFISRLLSLPTANGRRDEAASLAREQECLLTTHSPFVPSDMSREKVLIFGKEDGKIVVRVPDIETYGATFDTIIEKCFGIKPPMSDVPRREIESLMESEDPAAIRAGIERLGDSVEKVFLMDRLIQVSQQKGP